MTGDHETHALYRFHDADGALLYVGMTADPSARFKAHKKGKSWWHEVSAVTVEKHPTRAATLNAERLAIVTEKPLHNVCHNSGNPNRVVEPVEDVSPDQAVTWEQRHRRITFHLNRELIREMKGVAAAEGMTLSGWVGTTLRSAVDGRSASPGGR